MLKAYILVIFLAFCVCYSEQDGSCDVLVMKVMSSKEVINIFKKSGHNNKNGSLVANSCHGSGLYYTYTPGKLTSNYNSIGIELAMEALADFDSGFFNGTMTYGDIYQYPLWYDQGISCEDIDYHPCPLPLKKGEWLYWKLNCPNIYIPNLTFKVQFFNYAQDLVACFEGRIQIF